jgi:hypothetical protein
MKIKNDATVRQVVEVAPVLPEEAESFERFAVTVVSR